MYRNYLPRVWITLLFFSPILSSILLQLHTFASSGALVRTEGILTQLLFEHALRIRMKENFPNTECTSVVNTPEVRTFDPPPIGEDESGVDADGASVATTTAYSTRTVNDTQASANSTSLPPPTPIALAKPEEGKGNGSLPSGPNLAGRINNLISTDVENITDCRDFMFLLIHAPLQTALCIAFLYTVLGWSSFVGMGILILGVWAPVQIGKWAHSVQVKRMTAVCNSLFF